ncbi:septum formation initiator family protein [Anaerotalea alkaliphila]|uniref:Cell division protein FtsL n=1 Tax=Anaerotalea alkaliphila TaxID=2662126 RepID=A0A7X5KLX5_9FIRM|nr:septum formation initiator family protein [Anaerotalea alkaliphila]NDL66138.1 hypothetical protein [Anaerotalea alkaliphila]
MRTERHTLRNPKAVATATAESYASPAGMGAQPIRRPVRPRDRFTVIEGGPSPDPKPKANNLYTFLLAFVIIATLLVCVVLLKTQLAVTALNSDILRLKREIANMNEQNQQLVEEIATAVDLEEIYRAATEEMGMVLPDKGQVFYIQQDDITYTKKYADITMPQNGAPTVANVLGFISKGW